MTDAPALSEIAGETRWTVFAGRLRSAMAAHSDYGLATAADVLEQVAAMRGQDVATLRNPLAAENWLVRHAPKILAQESPQVAMTNVLLLAQIHEISAVDYARLAPSVFDGSARRAYLKAGLATAKAAAGSEGGIGHARWRRAHDFENLVRSFFEADLDTMENLRKPIVVERDRNATVPCDFVIESEGCPPIAVEVKPARQKLTHKIQVEALGVASLLLQDFREVFLIGEGTWSRVMPRAAEIRDRLGLDGVRLFTLHTKPPGNGLELREYIGKKGKIPGTVRRFPGPRRRR